MNQTNINSSAIIDTDLASTALAADDPERQPCEIWTRVMGYHRPVSSFNTGKQGEFHERRWFREGAVAQPLAAH